MSRITPLIFLVLLALPALALATSSEEADSLDTFMRSLTPKMMKQLKKLRAHEHRLLKRLRCSLRRRRTIVMYTRLRRQIRKCLRQNQDKKKRSELKALCKSKTENDALILKMKAKCRVSDEPYWCRKKSVMPLLAKKQEILDACVKLGFTKGIEELVRGREMVGKCNSLDEVTKKLRNAKKLKCATERKNRMKLKEVRKKIDMILKMNGPRPSAHPRKV